MPARPPATPDQRPAARWLIRLRLWWVGLLALALGGLGARLGVASPWPWLALGLGLSALSNLPLARRLLAPEAARAERLPTLPVAAALGLDVAVLMGLLALSGGAHNPFSVLALVQIALAASLLPPAATWALCGLAVAGYGALFWADSPAVVALVGGAAPPPAGEDCPHCAVAESGLSAHLQGMWIGFSIACGLVAHFVTRLSAAAQDRGRALLALAHSEARQRRLAALSTLAAGAAHELATPLGTIALVAGELERGAEGLSADAREDLRLLVGETARCRGILDRMAAGGRADAPVALGRPVTAAEAAAALSARLGPEIARLELAVDEGLQVLAPPAALTEALWCLVRNALDASPPGAPVRLEIAGDPAGVRFEVRDTGSGMDAELLATACEPFVTTKPPGAGQGLGLFLVEGFAHATRGALSLRSAPGAGTTATLTLPAHT